MAKNEVVVIGAGLAGCLAAIVLARRGIGVTLFERRPDLRRQAVPAGRSINLSLSARGIQALRQVGLYREVRRHWIDMPGRMLHSPAGEQRFQPYGRNPSAVHYSVSRSALNRILLDGAEAAGRVTIFFEQRCTGIDFEAQTLSLQNESEGTPYVFGFETLIAADGSASAVRTAMARGGAIEVREEPLPHGYKELTIPAAAGGAYRMKKNALHIWPRGDLMLIALPNTDGSFTATLFLPHRGGRSFESLTDDSAVLDFFRAEFPDAVPLVPDLAHAFFDHPTGHLETVRCFPWHLESKALLLGDAAHAIVPFHGQGMNCAFEDCLTLDQGLEGFPGWENLFCEFEALRKPNTDAIADMALENYVEMRDAVRDPKFHLRKEIEWLLEARYPKRFISRYAMVMFHCIPYALAQQRGAIQARILDALSESIDDVKEVDLRKADRLVREKLSPLPEIGL